MTPRELRKAEQRLVSFLTPILAQIGRAERRQWAGFYVRGLLLEGGRKTAAGMARRYGGDEQAL
ncbi:MAG: transposase, partial [Actinomycetia bacterium]|nr:transposase [Actinomycetes bacterium]